MIMNGVEALVSTLEATKKRKLTNPASASSFEQGLTVEKVVEASDRTIRAHPKLLDSKSKLLVKSCSGIVKDFLRCLNPDIPKNVQTTFFTVVST